jgi:hypothetical protein
MMDKNLSENYCPATCPNRMSRLGKGYSFLFSIALTVLLAWQSCDVMYSRSKGLEVKTRDIPMAIFLPSFFLIAGALGLNTDPIAQTLGRFLSRD